MQIILATSPHVRHAAVLQSDFNPDPSVMYSFAPVGLLSLASVLRESERPDPILYDFNQAIVSLAIPLNEKFYRSAAERICAYMPDLLGFMTECDSYHHILQVMEQVKQLRPECRCVLGGPHATAVAHQTMARCSYIDAIVLGEGEKTFIDLVTTYESGKTEAVPGALVRGANGNTLDGDPRQLVLNLDDLPIPAYDLYPGVEEEEIFIEVGRGCPFQCTFCSTAPFWQRRHRVKSPVRILEEIRIVQQLYRSKRVHFTHDLLTTDKRWVTSLCQTLIKAGSPVKWTCSARTDTVDRQMMELMANAGCNAIYFGIESGSARVLKDIDKDVPIEQSLSILEQCRDAGITPNAGFIVGFPMEDRESLQDTFSSYERALAMGTRPTHLFGFCPFAASSLYKQLNNLECHGHFLDIPITPEIDEANRRLIASDCDLFGGYFRPQLTILSTNLKGSDEFSNLVEPLAAPTLKLSRAIGGMLEVFDRWTQWIERRNKAAGTALHRRFYGTPLTFTEFVVEELKAVFLPDDPMLQLAELIRMSLSLGNKWANVLPTTMATHRSVDMPKLGEPVILGDQLRLKTALATLRVDYDLLPLLDATPDKMVEPVRKPTYLMWDLSENGYVRLSQVDPILFAALEQLQEGPKPVAELMLEWANAGLIVDYDRLMQVLTEAKNLHLVETL